jgi:hypothetical protein
MLTIDRAPATTGRPHRHRTVVLSGIAVLFFVLVLAAVFVLPDPSTRMMCFGAGMAVTVWASWAAGFEFARMLIARRLDDKEEC